jgi:hypothetical protein
MITDKLRELTAAFVKGEINSSQIGYGGNSSNPLANTLDVPSGLSTSIVKSTADDNVIEIKVSVAGSLLTGRVTREMGLFDASNNLLARVNFEGVGPFAADETLEIFLILEVE